MTFLPILTHQASTITVTAFKGLIHSRCVLSACNICCPSEVTNLKILVLLFWSWDEDDDAQLSQSGTATPQLLLEVLDSLCGYSTPG